MSTLLGGPRPSWFVRNSWIPMVVASVSLIATASVSAMDVGEALGVVYLSGSTRTLGAACDRAVELLLTTHDSVELERSRILVNTLRLQRLRLAGPVAGQPRRKAGVVSVDQGHRFANGLRFFLASIEFNTGRPMSDDEAGRRLGGEIPSTGRSRPRYVEPVQDGARIQRILYCDA